MGGLKSNLMVSDGLISSIPHWITFNICESKNKTPIPLKITDEFSTCCDIPNRKRMTSTSWRYRKLVAASMDLNGRKYPIYWTRCSALSQLKLSSMNTVQSKRQGEFLGVQTLFIFLGNELKIVMSLKQQVGLIGVLSSSLK